MKKLDDPLPMGYSSAGTVIACGDGVQQYKPGDRVASNGPHAGVVCVPKNLCAKIPDNVSFEQASFSVLSAIAVQGIRLADLQMGATAFVIGLGLIGQITVALLKAQGCFVIGTDLDDSKCELALKMGADIAVSNASGSFVFENSRGLGADAVLITAATKGDGPIELASAAVRQKGKIVAVGLVGLTLPRRDLYFKEAEVIVSCSYGPGRYDPFYENLGNDYPPAYVRWTEQRNMQSVLDLMGQGKLNFEPLVSHTFDIDDALKAYQLIESGEKKYLGMIIEHKADDARTAIDTIELRSHAPTGTPGYGILGVGNFAKAVILPTIQKETRLVPKVVCSAGGLSAAQVGASTAFEKATTNEQEVYAHPDINAVFIITQHNQHARQVIDALNAKKNVFVEKPLALTEEELSDIETTLTKLGDDAPLVMVGFNRRFSRAAWTVKHFFDDVVSPITVSIRFNAGEIPAEHWTQNEQIGGGRIIGEGCHAIDLATYLTGAVPMRVYAESIGGETAPVITDDQCFITLRHRNGSISNIAYLAGGDKSFPKERIEVIGGGKVAVIDDFRTVTLVSGGRTETRNLGGQDKGHGTEINMFGRAVADGGAAPIPWQDLHAVSLASIRAVKSLREGIPFLI